MIDSKGKKIEFWPGGGAGPRVGLEISGRYLIRCGLVKSPCRSETLPGSCPASQPCRQF